MDNTSLPHDAEETRRQNAALKSRCNMLFISIHHWLNYMADKSPDNELLRLATDSLNKGVLTIELNDDYDSESKYKDYCYYSSPETVGGKATITYFNAKVRIDPNNDPRKWIRSGYPLLRQDITKPFIDDFLACVRSNRYMLEGAAVARKTALDNRAKRPNIATCAM